MKTKILCILLLSSSIIGCGGGSDNPTPPPVQNTNTTPMANAGEDQSLELGSTVSLDGSASSDADGDNLTYLWKIDSQPSNSNLEIPDSENVKITFLPMAVGSYTLSLTVNDGTVSSTPDQVIVEITEPDNLVPIAVAGNEQTLELGDTVTLDGTGSSDDDGDDLSYQWSINERPNGSNAELTDSVSAIISFLPDVVGSYTLSLIVNDGTSESEPDYVTVNITEPVNLPPVAVAEKDSSIPVDTQITLTGDKSYDPEGQQISYQWQIANKPNESKTTLNDTSLSSITFKPDIAGKYIMSLTVNDGISDSSEVDIEVIAYKQTFLTYNYISGVDIQNISMRNIEQDYLNLEGMIAADLTGDGKDEFIVTPGYIHLDRAQELPIIIFGTNTDGVVSDITSSIIEGTIPSTGWVNTPILVDDFNNDGFNDLFMMDHGREDGNNDSFGGHANILLLSNGNGKLVYSTDTHLPVHNTYNHGGSAGDLDNDGDIDVLVSGFNYTEPRNNPELNTLYFENSGNGLFNFNHDVIPQLERDVYSPPITSAGTNLITDINADGKNDMIFASYVSNDTETDQSLRIYLGNAEGGFDDLIAIPWAESIATLGANQVVSEDFNQDLLPDILVKLENGGEGIWYLEQQHNCTFNDQTDNSFGTTGKLDLGHIYDLGSPDSFFPHDFNLDGIPDIYVVYSSVDSRHPDDGRDILAENLQKNIFVNDGYGHFHKANSVTIQNSEQALDKGAFIPGDINGDGKTDYFYIETNYDFNRVRVSALLAQ